MTLSRRDVLSCAVGAAVPISTARGQPVFDNAPPLPRAELFEAGDLVWPKKPGTFVPYSQSADATPDADGRIWEREKAEFLARSERGASQLTNDELRELRSLDYREFVARYHGNQKPGEPGVYSGGGGLYVGHVGIIDMAASGEPFVVEALWDRGVERRSYPDWIAGRPGEAVWLGRLRDRSPNERASVAREAVKHVGRPYDFWNFDLNDDAAFYCSKLVWLAIFRSLRVPVDGNANPRRAFWFSPKQLLYSPVVARLHDPGPYASR
jgi:hypothetical protein